MIALLQRTNLFMGILLVVAILITQNARRPVSSQNELTTGNKSAFRWFGKRPAIALTALFLIIAFAGFQIVDGALGKSPSSLAVSTGNVSPVLQSTGLQSPFMYYTGGIPAFLQLVDSTNTNWPPPVVPKEIRKGDYDPQTWGAATFSPILKALPAAKPWDSINAFIDMGVYTNVFTWLETFYRDFRVLGVIVGTALLGYLIGTLHRFRFASVRLFWIQATFISTIFLATFVPKINNTLFISELAFIYVLTLTWPRTLFRKLFPLRTTDIETEDLSGSVL
jgi:hypothetical protein